MHYSMKDTAVTVLTKNDILDIDDIILDLKEVLRYKDSFVCIAPLPTKPYSIQIMLTYQFKMIIFNIF